MCGWVGGKRGGCGWRWWEEEEEVCLGSLVQANCGGGLASALVQHSRLISSCSTWWERSGRLDLMPRSMSLGGTREMRDELVRWRVGEREREREFFFCLGDKI